MAKNSPVKHLLWVDLEMTGLDPKKEVIIEVAALITDIDFNILESYESVVKQPQKFLDQMDEWNKKTHGSSGLIQKIPFGKEPQVVEQDLIHLIQRHFYNDGERPILCGNSISQDRAFINEYWPNLAEKLHYRMLDVSSWKILFNNKFNVKYEKSEKHRALDDIQESINELKLYLKHVRTTL